MTDAMVTEWCVKEGDVLKANQVLLLAETDKAVQEIPVTEPGIVVRLLVAEGENVEVQTPIMVVAGETEAFTEEEVDEMVRLSVNQASSDAIPSSSDSQMQMIKSVKDDSRVRGRVKITPLARKTAQKLGVDYLLITPSQKTNRIVKKDILDFVAERTSDALHVSSPQSSAISPVVQRTPVAPFSQQLSPVRALIATRMTESVNTKPSVPLTLTVDADALLEWRIKSEKMNRKIKINAMLIAAVARALSEFPIMNASLVGDVIESKGRINVGIAVDTERGLMVPKVFDADKKNPADIQLELDMLVDKVRLGVVEPESLKGGTFTITNLGMYEIEQFAAIINPPETAILAVGMIKAMPIVRNGELAIGNVMTLTLSFDHRVIDGGPAARFLQQVKHLLESPVNIFC